MSEYVMTQIHYNSFHTSVSSQQLYQLECCLPQNTVSNKRSCFSPLTNDSFLVTNSGSATGTVIPSRFVKSAILRSSRSYTFSTLYMHSRDKSFHSILGLTIILSNISTLMNLFVFLGESYALRFLSSCDLPFLTAVVSILRDV